MQDWTPWLADPRAAAMVAGVVVVLIYLEYRHHAEAKAPKSPSHNDLAYAAQLQKATAEAVKELKKLTNCEHPVPEDVEGILAQNKLSERYRFTLFWVTILANIVYAVIRDFAVPYLLELILYG